MNTHTPRRRRTLRYPLFSPLAFFAGAVILAAGVASAEQRSIGRGPSGTFESVEKMIDPGEGQASAAEDTYGPDGSIDVPLGGSNTPAIAINPTDRQNTAIGFFSEIRVSSDGGMTFQPPVAATAFPGSDEDGDGLDGEDPVEAGVDNDNDGAVDEDPLDLVDNDNDGLIDEDPAVDVDNDGDGQLNEDPDFQEIAGHPVVAFDSEGRLFWTYLVSANVRFDSGGDGTLDSRSTLGVDVALAQADPGTGAIQAGYPVNITGSVEVNFPAVEGNLNDKEWMAVDRFPGSPFKDRIYVVWTQFLEGGATAIRTSHSIDQGRTWSRPLTLSAAGEGFVWPSHNAVAADGDVYVTYHCQPGQGICGVPDGTGQVKVLRSADGGLSYLSKTIAFGSGKADITFNVQVAPRSLHKSASWTQGSAQPWVLPDPLNPEHVYVVAADDPTDSNHGAGFDDMDIFIARSTSKGLSWDAPRRVDDGPEGSTQFFPAAAIDDDTGCIAVTYYDTRARTTNAAGNYLLDFFLRSSIDGGLTFGPEVRINDLPFDPDFGAPCRFNCIAAADSDGDGRVDEDPCDGADNDEDGKVDEDPEDIPTSRIGEYNGVAVSLGDAQMVWTGNDTAGQQIFFDAAITCTVAPVADAGPDQTVECTSPEGTEVALDGSGSSAADSDTLTYSWTGPFGTAEGPTPVVLLPMGVHVITLTVEDGLGGADSDTVEITVVDTTPPEIESAIADPSVLWPPNHKMVDVNLVLSVTDSCDPSPLCEIISISSNEPVNGTGDGNTSPDYLITGPLTAQLRAERSGRGNGRVYTMEVECSDASGNVATTTVPVLVPHDQGNNGGLWIRPGLVHPFPRSKLCPGGTRFGWDRGTWNPRYWAVWIGNAPGTYDVYANWTYGQANEITVPGLPQDGRTLHVKLWCFVGRWIEAGNYQYEACGLKPQLITPAPESHLSASTATVSWDHGTANPRYWAIWIGTKPNSYDVFANWTHGGASSMNVHGLPNDGRRLYATLWSWNRSWARAVEQSFHASDTGPKIISPYPGGAFRTSSTTITWDDGGLHPEYWAIWVGSAPGTYDIFASLASGASNSLRVSGLPTDGRNCYARLWYYAGHRWHPGPTYQYRAPGG